LKVVVDGALETSLLEQSAEALTDETGGSCYSLFTQTDVSLALRDPKKRAHDDDWKPGVIHEKKKAKKVVVATTPPKKPRAKKNPSDKVSFQVWIALVNYRFSFQEAAVRVLQEQRQRGVYALSTRKIWELIQQSGLVDTKYETEP
jgi:hypothetical protein